MSRSSVNFDADLVRDGGANLSRTDEALVEMSNGCISCTLRDDLLKEERRLAGERRFDHLLIESTGISEPLPVAFAFRDKEGLSLSDVARLDMTVTVLGLLVEQIEFADVIVLNKVDVATPERLEAARTIVRSLKADTRVIDTTEPRVPPDAILETGVFSFEAARNHPTWVREPNGFKDHVPETEEYGITSFVFRAVHRLTRRSCTLSSTSLAHRGTRQGLLLAGLTAAAGGRAVPCRCHGAS